MKIALLGGSFNPPHTGHLSLAEDVRLTLGYDKVFFVPVNIAPHKKMAIGAGDQDRINMLQLAIAGNDGFGLELCELNRGGVSYTIDTIRYLTKFYGNQLSEKIGFILGDDLVAGFSSWRCAAELAEEANLILVRRNFGAAEEIDFPFRHIEVETTVLPIASSSIRQKIAGGEGWRYLVPNGVYEYITERKLYENE